jgi:1,4-dihydroxy-2-naphthoate octaprenyltransferase
LRMPNYHIIFVTVKNITWWILIFTASVQDWDKKKIEPVYRKNKKKENVPQLRQSVTGCRHWDFLFFWV